MKRWMLGFLVVLFSVTLAAAQQTPPNPCPRPLASCYKLWRTTTTAYWGITSISSAM